MATYTPNLNLIKPAGTDYVRVGDFNDNANVLDAAIGNLGQLTTDAKASLVLAINEAALRGGENAPYIDDTTGNWMMWDVATAQYVDTGVHAEGADGSDGADGISAFVWIKWSAIQPTQNSDMKDTPGQFIGVYSGTSPTAPTAYTSYQWYKYKGDKGDKGDTGVTVTVGTTTTGAAGTQASVSNSGTASDPILNFTIPQGATGAGVPDGGTDGQIIVKSGVSAVWQDQNTVDGIAAIDGNIPLSAARQYSTMPTVTTADNGTIAQYIGTDETTYKTGHWYEVVSGAWQEIVYGDPNSVSYDAQSKTVTQKAQARTNIGAAGTSELAHPNMLINGWFQVNQRGLSAFTAGSYGLDMWLLESGGSCSVGSGSISLTGTLTQRLEAAYASWALNGTPCTLSVNINGTIYSKTLTPSASANVYDTLTTGVTVGLYNGATWKEFRITTTSATTILAAKLEVGNVSTLAMDAPANYGEQLALCQRYFEAMYIPFFKQTNAEYFYPYSQFKVSKRVSPTLISPTLGSTITYDYGSTMSIALRAIRLNPTNIPWINGTGDSNTQIAAYFIPMFYFSAEL